MSLWGTVRSYVDERLHVVPVTSSGRVLEPHVLSADCPCQPQQDTEEPTMLVHQDKERGGFQ